MNYTSRIIAFVLLSFSSLILPSLANTDSLRHETFTYKTVGHLEIQAEVSRPDDDINRPVVVWIHGGALMKGDRFGQWKKDFPILMLQAGYIIVSIDYRLAPETKLPFIIEDVVDACAWVRANGEELFGANVDRLAIAGGSAGGYLTLAAGAHVKPEPTVIASFYGYCDITADWAIVPSHDPSHLETKLEADRAEKFEPGPEVSNKYERTYDITPYYNHWRQTGQWPIQTTGFDPKTESEQYRNLTTDLLVTNRYPPAFLAHGTEDLDVAHTQSLQMVEALKKHGVRHELIIAQGAEHGFRGVEPGRIDALYRKAMAFVRYHMEE